MAKYTDIVDIRKMTNCPVCYTYLYTLPVPLSKNIEDFLLPFGKMAYNLNSCQIVRIDNELLELFQARLGTDSFRIKFKKDPEKTKEFFDIQLAAYLEVELNKHIEM